MKPSSFSWLLNVKSTANQMKVASTSPSSATSPSVSTPVTSSTPRPRNAMAVESRPSVAAAPQSATMPANVTATIFSWRLKRAHAPQRLRAPRAAPRAWPSLRAG